MLSMPMAPAPAGERRYACAPVHLPPAARALLDLAPDQCRWPLGEPGEEAFTFCGEPRAFRSRYCAVHARAGRLGGRP